MKRLSLLIVVIAVMLLSVIPAYADNSARIKELTAELQDLDMKYRQAGQFMKQCETEAAEKSGAIKELQRQDAAVKAAGETKGAEEKKVEKKAGK